MGGQHVESKPAKPGPSRESVVKLLEFAREHIRGQMELEGCPHHGWFATDDVRCWACGAATECAWLLHNDGVLPWHSRSLPDLILALRYAMESIDLQVRKWEHTTQSCRCEVCDWLRSARQLGEIG